MFRRLTLTLLFVLVFAFTAGCEMSPRKRYVLAERNFTGVVEAGTVLLDHDIIEPEPARSIVNRGSNVLDEWGESLKRWEEDPQDERPPEPEVDALAQLLRELVQELEVIYYGD